MYNFRIRNRIEWNKTHDSVLEKDTVAQAIDTQHLMQGAIWIPPQTNLVTRNNVPPFNSVSRANGFEFRIMFRPPNEPSSRKTPKMVEVRGDAEFCRCIQSIPLREVFQGHSQRYGGDEASIGRDSG